MIKNWWRKYYNFQIQIYAHNLIVNCIVYMLFLFQQIHIKFPHFSRGCISQINTNFYQKWSSNQLTYQLVQIWLHMSNSPKTIPQINQHTICVLSFLNIFQRFNLINPNSLKCPLLLNPPSPNDWTHFLCVHPFQNYVNRPKLVVIYFSFTFSYKSIAQQKQIQSTSIHSFLAIFD